MKLEELHESQISQETIDRWEAEAPLVESCSAEDHLAELDNIIAEMEQNGEKTDII